MSTRVISRNKLSPDIILRETMIDTQVLNPGGKSFIQPEVGPPFLEREDGTVKNKLPNSFM